MEREIKLNENKARLNNYLQKLDDLEKDREFRTNLEKDPDARNMAINKACKKCEIVSLDKMLGKIYNDAIPIEDGVADIDRDISDYINAKTHGKDTEYYIKETIRKNHSPFLTKMCEAAKTMANKHRARKENMIEVNPSISLNELESYRFDNTENNNLQDITSDMGFDEVSEIIRNNVKTTIQDEFDRNENEQQQIQALEDELAGNDEIVDTETMESAIVKELFKRGYDERLHQPSLFEGVLQYYTENFSDKRNDLILNKAICDYTLLSTMKALRLDESLGNRLTVSNLARKYKR